MQFSISPRSSAQPGFFLRAHAWKLFVLSTLPAILVMVFLSQFESSPVLLVLALVIGSVPWLMWLHTLGMTLGRITQKLTPSRVGFFSFNVVFCFLYLLAGAITLAEILRRGSVGEEFLWVFGAAIPAQLYAAFALYYAVYYVARRLSTIELQRTTAFNDNLQNFVLLFFFPVGVWVVQPIINQLFADTPES